MWRCYFSMLACLHFVVCLNTTTSILLLNHEETQVASGLGYSVSMPLPVLSVSSSRSYHSTSSTHNDGNENGTQSEPANSVIGGAGLDGAISLPLRITNATTEQDPPAIEGDDGSQQHEGYRGTSTIQNCPEQPHICSHDDCGGNVSCPELSTRPLPQYFPERTAFVCYSYHPSRLRSYSIALFPFCRTHSHQVVFNV
jgi:hypothetical protein